MTDSGSITHAARALGCSSSLCVGHSEEVGESPWRAAHRLGTGSEGAPTEFAQKLVWAERRARIRMQPTLRRLRSDLTRVLLGARDPRHQLLTVRASHDLALPVLQQHAAKAMNLHLNVSFPGECRCPSGVERSSVSDRWVSCSALRGAAPVFAKALKPRLKPRVHQLISCFRRMQGVMVRKEHAGLVRTFPDVVERQLRFVNRQPGSGTRMLIEHLMYEHSISPAQVSGYAEHLEHTHVSVALCVASGVVDVGIGIEAAALQFGLHFVPLVEESYFPRMPGAERHSPGGQALAGGPGR